MAAPTSPPIPASFFFPATIGAGVKDKFLVLLSPSFNKSLLLIFAPNFAIHQHHPPLLLLQSHVRSTQQARERACFHSACVSFPPLEPCDFSLQGLQHAVAPARILKRQQKAWVLPFSRSLRVRVLRFGF